MLSASDPLGSAPRRVLVAGTSGAGKTTLARRIGQVLDLPVTEIDGLWHGPDWTVLPSFADEVEAYSSRPTWISEWQYTSVRPMLAARADTLVWLDLALPVAFWRLVRRTVRRRLRHEVLWNGNTEPSLWSILWRRDHIIRWGISSARSSRRNVPTLEVTAPHLRIVRLRSQSDVEVFLRCLGEWSP